MSIDTTPAPSERRSQSPRTEVPRLSSTRTRSALLLPSGRASDLGLAVTVGVIAALAGIAGIHTPSIWSDEAVTMRSAALPPSELFALLGRIDLVHGLYYALVHVWFSAVGDSLVGLRLLSCLAIGVTAGLVVALGRRMVDRTFGVVSGLVFAALPATTEMATDGRSRAIGVLVVVASSLALWCATERFRAPGRPRSWIGYAAIATAAVLVNVYSALVIAGHGISCLVGAPRRRRRRIVLAWFAAAGAVGLVLVPFVLIAAGQSGQIAWRLPVELRDAPRLFLVSQWFPRSLPAAAVGWTLAVVGVVTGLRAPRTRPVVALAVPWLMVLPSVILTAGLAGTSLYGPRYSSACTPALAMLIALGLLSLRHRRVLTTVAAIAVLTTSAFGWIGLHTRSDRVDWDAAADRIAAERAVSRGPGGIVYGTTQNHAEQLGIARPEAVLGLLDLTYVGPPPTTQFWDRRVGLEEAPERAVGLRDVWFVGERGRELDRLTSRLAGVGFVAIRTSGFGPSGVVVQFERVGYTHQRDTVGPAGRIHHPDERATGAEPEASPDRSS